MFTRKDYRYRIYTEHKNVTAVSEIIQKYFPGFTLYIGIGMWKNTAEKNLTVEIISHSSVMNDITAVCLHINRINIQECCMVTVDRVKKTFI